MLSITAAPPPLPAPLLPLPLHTVTPPPLSPVIRTASRIAFPLEQFHRFTDSCYIYTLRDGVHVSSHPVFTLFLVSPRSAGLEPEDSK